jgi:methylglutaconyl-CoA hydratase
VNTAARDGQAPVLAVFSAGIARLTLNRPEKRNALNRATLTALAAELERCKHDPAVRVVQITGAGKVFTAGADLAEMQAQADATEADNVEHAQQLALLLGALYAFPKPTLARVNGDGFGGALGLIAACDIVVAAEDAKFAFTEVRLGIIPAVISPFVLGKIGESAALRFFLTAEVFDAAMLRELGLAHQVVATDRLDGACEALLAELMKGAPTAQAEAKKLIREGSNRPSTERAQASVDLAARLARLRVQPEAREGFAAFFAKRKAQWRID